MDGIRGRLPHVPTLPSTTSKFGGIPYAERSGELSGGRFIGQVNFAEVARFLTEQQFPIPVGMPSSGLLAVDSAPGTFSGRVRWYPDPNQTKAIHLHRADTVAKYEASIGFKGSWSLRGLDWFDAVPKNDDELWTYLNDLEIDGVDEDARDGHKLFGHANDALNEHYDFDPIAGRSRDIREYALVWRINFDNPAGFAWGTNWIYVVIHQDDLSQGAFDRAVVTGANA